MIFNDEAAGTPVLIKRAEGQAVLGKVDGLRADAYRPKFR